MRIVYLIGAFIAMTMMGCGGSQNKTAPTEGENATTEVTEQANNYFGTYEGVLPCADCEGIKTKLEIAEDKTYNLVSEYIGKKDGTFETSGVYNVIGDNIIELVTPSTGDKTYYKIQENSVVLSDEAGNVNTGELAEHYILKKI